MSDSRRADDRTTVMAGLEPQAHRVATELGRLMASLGLRIVTAESCTGGLVARALTETAGSSGWFDRGFVTYSDDAKRESLGVSQATLARHGAVSEPVALEMALGALGRSRAALALAVTGIAGPTGAVPGKPVGTVCFAWAFIGPSSDGPTTHAETLRFDGDRASVRLQSALHSLATGLARVRAELADRPATA